MFLRRELVAGSAGTVALNTHVSMSVWDGPASSVPADAARRLADADSVTNRRDARARCPVISALGLGVVRGPIRSRATSRARSRSVVWPPPRCSAAKCR